MTTHDEIETRLRRAVAVAPSDDGLRWLDQRVAQMVATSAATHRRGQPSLRTFLRPLALIATFVVLTGTVVGAMGLLERTVDSNPGWRTAWDRAEILGIRQTDAGVTITLERAYADLNQVLVGFTVEGLESAPLSSHGEPAKIEWSAELRDPTGRRDYQWAPSELGSLGVETNLSAVVQTWLGAVAPVAGTWELTFTSVGYNSGGMVSGECTVGNTDPACETPPANAMVDGTWRFEFELPKPTGTVVSADASDTVGQATVTLTELRIAPTMIAGTLVLRVADSTVAQWGSINVSFRHGGTSYVVNHSSALSPEEALEGLAGGGDHEFHALVGSDEAAGTWEIEIPELTYSSSIDSPEIHLAGPWTLTVTVP